MEFLLFKRLYTARWRSGYVQGDASSDHANLVNNQPSLDEAARSDVLRTFKSLILMKLNTWNRID